MKKIKYNDPFIKPEGKGITDEDWNVYLCTAIRGHIGHPVSITSYEIYKTVESKINGTYQAKTLPIKSLTNNGWPNCVRNV